MKIILTGGNGFLGKSLYTKLITNDQAKNLISSNVKIIQFKGPAGKKDLIVNSNIFFKFFKLY